MLGQAQDFLDESEALYELISHLDDLALMRKTAFKGWSIEDVIGHLHLWNHAADLSLRDQSGFQDFFRPIANHLKTGTLNKFEKEWLGELKGRARVAKWVESCRELAKYFGDADPKARVVWAGPSMSVRSSITARLMETWAHGQSVYDLLGVPRVNHDRIGNIVVLGINTFGWTFNVNGLAVPDRMPRVELVAPSGSVWAYGEESQSERIDGLAEEFCQVVTQTRNIKDTSLKVRGETARHWMAIAQCFAGGAEAPPAPGSRVPKIG